MSVDVVDLELASHESAAAAAGTWSGDGGRWAGWSLRAGLALLALVIFASLVVRVFHVGSPDTPAYAALLRAPSLAHPFGTDELGRDVFIRCLYATFTDFRIALVATLVPLLFGLIVGGLAGYVGGWFGALVLRITEFIQTFPSLVLTLVIIAIIGPGLTGIYIGLIVGGLPTYIRLTRGEMLVLREQQFILAAQTLGFSTRRVVLRHALPHVLRPNFVVSLSDVLLNILAVAALSFLGLGVQPPTPEWGSMISDGETYLYTSWWISTMPGLFLTIVGLSISLTGEALADRLRVHVTGVT